MLPITTILFPSCPDLHLEEITRKNLTLFVTVRSSQPSMRCPDCAHESLKIHSRYSRTLADLSLMEYAVVLRIQVRRFFCSNPACPRKTFAEPFAGLTMAHARRTNRQASRLSAIAKELGGRPAARESENVQMPVSRHTMLRLLRRTPVPDAPPPRVLGVDDWAIRKGQTYATLLVDLQRHRIVDVLPDREAETLEVWLTAHPGVEVISRDRAGTYAQGSRKGAPQAQQVTDRFHLLLNLREALKRHFERRHDLLQQEADQQPDVLTLSEDAVDPQEAVATPALTTTALQQQAQREQRQRRYEEVLHWREQGASQVAIAALTGLHRETVRRYLNASGFPEITRPNKRSRLDPYKPFLQQRWGEGERNVKHLLVELRERGYRQGATIVYDYLRTLRAQPAGNAHLRKRSSAHAGSHDVLSAREAAWLFVSNPQKLRFSQVVRLDHLRRMDEKLAFLYQLTQDFRAMVTLRQEAVLGRWLEEAKSSGIKEMQSLAAGILRDFDAVRGALTMEWSNGQTEGKVNKLKCIKRQMYGRAHFDLLRKRMLLCV
ncbi:MAG TPA: ISL3 family transposase [Ktedonobacteraceae bacterium]|nr:ISL3 family transposase [Ktedonobacteraceae bacterium]